MQGLPRDAGRRTALRRKAWIAPALAALLLHAAVLGGLRADRVAPMAAGAASQSMLQVRALPPAATESGVRSPAATAIDRPSVSAEAGRPDAGAAHVVPAALLTQVALEIPSVDPAVEAELLPARVAAELPAEAAAEPVPPDQAMAEPALAAQATPEPPADADSVPRTFVADAAAQPRRTPCTNRRRRPQPPTRRFRSIARRSRRR